MTRSTGGTVRKRRELFREVRMCDTCRKKTEHVVYESWQAGGGWLKTSADRRVAARCNTCKFRTLEPAN